MLYRVHLQQAVPGQRLYIRAVVERSCDHLAFGSAAFEFDDGQRAVSRNSKQVETLAIGRQELASKDEELTVEDGDVLREHILEKSLAGHRCLRDCSGPTRA
jgi:hypothetical protein